MTTPKNLGAVAANTATTPKTQHILPKDFIAFNYKCQ